MKLLLPNSYNDGLIGFMKNNYSSLNNLENIHIDKNDTNQKQHLYNSKIADINQILNRVKLNQKNEKKNMLLKSALATLLVIFTIIITRF